MKKLSNNVKPIDDDRRETNGRLVNLLFGRVVGQEVKEALKTAEVGLGNGRPEKKGVDVRKDDSKVRDVGQRSEKPVLYG